MTDGREGGGWKSWVAGALLPSCVVVLSALLYRWMSGPTAAGIAFLAVILVAYLLFPKIKLSAARVAVGLLLALAVAYVLALMSLGHK